MTSRMHSFSFKLIWAHLLLLYLLIISPSFSFSAPLYPANIVTLFGDASFENNSIRLTQNHPCTTSSSLSPSSQSDTSTSLSGIGRAFYVYPIRFLDSSSRATASFSCSFSFTITPTLSCPSGDGLAFLITSNMNSLSICNGCMGLPEDVVSDNQDSFTAVEFDTSFNPFYDDVNGNHVGVDVKKIKSLASVDVVSRGIDLKAGKEMTTWIEYRNSEKMIRIWVGYSQVRPLNPILVAQVDFSEVFKEFMYVGFSASNGGGSAIHSIYNWRFKTFWFRSSTMSMDAVEEGDCLMCFPGDFSPDFDHPRRRKSRRILVLGGSVAIMIILVAVFMICMCLMRRRRRSKSKRRGSEDHHIGRFQGSKVPKYLSLTEIKEATNGFNKDRIIGEGASAVVYEGSIPSCGSVAVKRFNQGKRIGISNDSLEIAARIFDTEFATTMGCLRHKNLVQLKGWCCEKNEMVLVYEYMHNGSLDKILHGQTSIKKFLTWERRLNIMLGVASALVYMHEECINQIIHRDVKTCNIMLDAEFTAKLGDFGLAEVYEHSSPRTRAATIPAGTMGYLAPEYVFSGVPTAKTDIYSFGVVVLEVVSGRRPVDEKRTLITDWVWELWEKGKIIQAADPRMKGCFNRRIMERMLMVGLHCAHPDHEKRPTMREAARMLQGEAPLPPLPPMRPILRIQSVLPEGCEEIMNFGEEIMNFGEEIMNFGEKTDGTPWSTPRTEFSRN
ncbi:hypothetical protein ACH5RR_034251 [Cinchona calisaya]|uniref:non-specific serine/threonine protein kinase n=1 Tax=Cinchona calisaya TaxID=153742 RepID=A0ABD2YB54_9GENT